MKKFYFSFLSLLIVVAAFAQTSGGIKVTLKDGATKEPIAFGTVIVFNGTAQAGVGQTDIDGNVTIKPLAPGKYNVKALYTGFTPKQTNDVVVGADKTSYITIAMSGGKELDEVQIVAYIEPLIDPDTKSGGTVTREEYQNLATKNINSAASTTAGVYQADEGSADLNIRGGRSSSNAVFVDGERVVGTYNIPQQGVEQVSVILGGVPASFGDATGGVISITTRGPQPKFTGSVEGITSQLTDPYGYNSLGFSLGGPLVRKKLEDGKKGDPILGIFLSGQTTIEKDRDPANIKFYRTKESKLADLEKNPVIFGSDNGATTRFISSDFVKESDLELVRVKKGNSGKAYLGTVKMDLKVSKAINFTLGGTYDYNNYDQFSWADQMFNYKRNDNITDRTMRAYVRMTHRLSNDNKDALVKNVYYSIQGGVSRRNINTYSDPNSKDNFFNYGYIGKFNIKRVYGDDFIALNRFPYLGLFPINGTPSHLFGTYTGTTTTFDRSEVNGVAANYTDAFFNQLANKTFNGAVEEIGIPAIRNGGNPQAVVTAWNNAGLNRNNYRTQEQDKTSFIANLNMDISNHALQLGLEYDQRTYRDYSVNPVGLWSLARVKANDHIANGALGDSTLILVGSTGGIPIYSLKPILNGRKESDFSIALREKLGISDNREFINTDAYDPSTFSLDMFSAEDLLGLGGNYVNSGGGHDIMGYDHTGKKVNSNFSFANFISKTDAKGRKALVAPAFKPIYFAAYVQDKFDIKDVKLNVGLRLDYYDANQLVLKNKFSFVELYDAKRIGLSTLPIGVKNTFIPYFKEENGLGDLVGYRDGDQWYDASGNKVISSEVISNTNNGQIFPVADIQKNEVNNFTKPLDKGFQDFKPQINFLPRIAFSFPISDVANFFAHYDILTRRPTVQESFFNPFDYYNIAPGNVINNPNLKPERTVDYELGYSQILNERKNAALKLSLFYRETKDQIQFTNVIDAYPYNYKTYQNVDYGTTKGLSIEFDLRRTNGFAFTTNYTLQFADGTGSSATSGVNLANSGQPNLKVPSALSNDQRHTLTANIDYRFGSGKDYKGLTTDRSKGEGQSKSIKWFEGVGVNLLTRLGSGTPYNRNSQIVSYSALAGANTTLVGQINSSYLPWQFRTDLRVDKNFGFTFNKDNENANGINLNVYLQVLNLFNTRNISNVYATTGSPTDDGFAATARGQLVASNASDRQSYLDLNRAKLLNPDNFGRARTIRLGLQIDF
jgi:TonB-dependent Receptor Plug Domain/Carboxypeptidase regulatory-like domain